jgi:hypothetical protein
VDRHPHPSAPPQDLHSDLLQSPTSKLSIQPLEPELRTPVLEFFNFAEQSLLRSEFCLEVLQKLTMNSDSGMQLQNTLSDCDAILV